MKYVVDPRTGLKFYPFMIKKKDVFFSSLDQSRPKKFVEGVGGRKPYIFLVCVKNKIFEIHRDKLRFYCMDNYYPGNYALDKDIAQPDNTLMQLFILCAMENHELAKTDAKIRQELELLVYFSKTMNVENILNGSRLNEHAYAVKCIFPENEQDLVSRRKKMDSLLASYSGGIYHYVELEKGEFKNENPIPEMKTEYRMDAHPDAKIGIVTIGSGSYKPVTICDVIAPNGQPSAHTVAEIDPNSRLFCCEAFVPEDESLPYEAEILSCYSKMGASTLALPQKFAGIKITGLIKGTFNELTGKIASLIITGTESSIDLSGTKCIKAVTMLPERKVMPIMTECTDLSEVTVPDNVLSIANNCFAGCTNLKTVKLGTSLKKIGYGAFKNCSSLENVEWNDSLETIEESSFEGCISIKSVSLPDTVKKIGVNAFKGCSALREFDAGKSLNCDLYAFEGCISLERLTINSSNQYSLRRGLLKDCHNISELSFSEGLTDVENFLPEDCKIREFHFPVSVTSFPIYAEKPFPEGSIIKTKSRNDRIYYACIDDPRVTYVLEDGSEIVSPEDEQILAQQHIRAQEEEKARERTAKMLEEEKKRQQEAEKMQAQAQSDIANALKARQNAMSGAMSNMQKAMAAMNPNAAAALSGALSGIANIPGVGNIPGIANIPDAANIPRTANIPGVANMPGIANIPNIPKASAIPDAPKATLRKTSGVNGNNYISFTADGDSLGFSGNVPVLLKDNKLIAAKDGKLMEMDLVTGQKNTWTVSADSINILHAKISPECKENDKTLTAVKEAPLLLKDVMRISAITTNLERINTFLESNNAGVKISKSPDGQSLINTANGNSITVEELIQKFLN